MLNDKITYENVLEHKNKLIFAKRDKMQLRGK